MSTYAERMADPDYAAHVHRIVAQMPEPTDLGTRHVRGLIAAGRRQAAVAAKTKAAQKTA